MINRHSDLKWVRTALKRSRVVALLGPRQSGKTTLARQFVPAESLNYFDLKLDELRVVYPGGKRYPLAKNVEVVPLVELVNAK